MKCTQCGHKNPQNVKFCTRCGTSLAARGAPASPAPGRRGSPPARAKGRSSSPRGSNRNGLFAVAAVAGAVLIYLAVRPDTPPGAGAAGPAPAFTASVQEVAGKFRCACGTCEVPELAQCTCPTAEEEKRFIEAQLQRGGTPNEVVRAVQRRYGGLKAQYASLVRPAGGAPTTSPSSGVAPVPPKAAAPPAATGAALAIAPTRLPSAATPSGDRLATLVDTTAVADRFSCACDTCGGLPLSECACQRRRGAAEMKAFIVYKIQQQLSVDEVVQAVAYEYGHLRPETGRGTP